MNLSKLVYKLRKENTSNLQNLQQTHTQNIHTQRYNVNMYHDSFKHIFAPIKTVFCYS